LTASTGQRSRTDPARGRESAGYAGTCRVSIPAGQYSDWGVAAGRAIGLSRPCKAEVGGSTPPAPTRNIPAQRVWPTSSVWKLDRAFRRLKEGVEFLDLCQQKGVAFVSVTEGIDTSTAFGPLLFALFAALAS
jgi:hypothetical protein